MYYQTVVIRVLNDTRLIDVTSFVNSLTSRKSVGLITDLH